MNPLRLPLSGRPTVSVGFRCLAPSFMAQRDLTVTLTFWSSLKQNVLQGFLKVSEMEMQLSDMLGGKKVGLRTSKNLSRYFRQAVVQEAVEQYGR